MIQVRTLIATAHFGSLMASAALASAAGTILKTLRKIGQVTGAGRPTAKVVRTVDPSGWRRMQALTPTTRRRPVQFGGFVPARGHDGRPAIRFIMSAQAVENGIKGAAPVARTADNSLDASGAGPRYWWANMGKMAVVLASRDLLRIEVINDPMMQMR